MKGDTILYCVGMKPKTDELMDLIKDFPNARFIGDCNKTGRILQAVRDGMFAGLDT